MPLIVTNNNQVTLGLALGSGDTTMTVSSIVGLPDVSASGDYTVLTIVNEDTSALEYVRCTDLDTLTRVYTIERAQEGTLAQEFPLGASVRNFFTAGMFTELSESASSALKTSSHTIDNTLSTSNPAGANSELLVLARYGNQLIEGVDYEFADGDSTVNFIGTQAVEGEEVKFVYTEGVLSITNAEDLPTSEVDTSKVLKPDGNGGLEWAQDPVGVAVTADLILDGTEVANRYIYTGNSNDTLTLPVASGLVAEKTYLFENRAEQSSRIWTIATQGGDTVDGSGSSTLAYGDTLLLECDGVSTYTTVSSGASVDATDINNVAGLSEVTDVNQITDLLILERAGSTYKVTPRALQSEGWANYADSTYTVGSPLAVNNARVQLTNDGLGGATNKTYLPDGISDLWSSDKITPENIGDSYDVRLNFTAEVSSQNGYFDVELDIGGGIGVIWGQTKVAPRTANTPTNYSVTIPIFTLGTFITNGGTIYIDSTDGAYNVDVYDIAIFIKRDYASA